MHSTKAKRIPILIKHVLFALVLACGLLGSGPVRAALGDDPTFVSDRACNGSSATFPGLNMTAQLGNNELIVRGPIAKPDWETRIGVRSYGRSGNDHHQWKSISTESGDHRVLWNGAVMDVEFLVGTEGIRQNFLVNDRPIGTGNLEIILDINSGLCPEAEGTNGIAFRTADGHLGHAYRDLRVWDACGEVLEASMSLNHGNSRLTITVDDQSATYPIVVDPVSTTEDRLLNPPIGGDFGYSVSTAGDLNGDGYSDVVVGAPQATSGQAGEGLVYVYYGSVTGIPAAPSVTLQVDQPGAQFGFSVDGAGDVNNDGYSDLLVGAPTWEDNAATDKEGAMFVFHGSAAGVATLPAVILQPNATNNYMGYSVSCLGDINGDGYSDVGVGGYLAAYPSFNEGVAWIYLGSAVGVNPVFRHRLERDQAAAQFGGSISAAGDVNGDGFSDVIIGAHKFELTPGCPTINTCDDGGIFIYHGSANALGAGANPAPARIFNTAGYSIHTGWAVSTAGDVNGDGYSDVIVGDWRDEMGPEISEGSAFIFHGSPAGVNIVPATIIQGNQAGAKLGRSVSTAGDVNGDGYADVIIGAQGYTNGQANEGAAFLHLGSASGVSSSAFLRYEGNGINVGMGESVNTAGDVNGDGYSDMIVGVPFQTGGRAKVFLGGTSNVSALPSFTSITGSAGAHLGWSVANAGDVNGDGYSDAIFGAPDGALGQPGEGLAYVHYGSITGLSAGPNLILQANLNNAAFGKSVASAGDVNGDGYADVVVGAPGATGGGAAFIFHGSPFGLIPSVALQLNGSPGSGFATSVFKAGDVNGDGFSDVVIGAPGSEEAYIYMGSSTGLDPIPAVTLAPSFPASEFGHAVCTAGDVNGDGFSDVIVGAPSFSAGQSNEGAFFIFHGSATGLSAAYSFLYQPNIVGFRAGSSVAGAGDVNGDGYFDVIIGESDATAPEANEGLARVLYGSPSGITILGITALQRNQVGANLGTSVAEAGDVNGDGYADVVIGAPNFDNDELNEGTLWVYLGGPTGILFASPVGVELNTAGDNFGFSVAGGGDTDGDGYSDIMGGGPQRTSGQGVVALFRGNNAESLNRLSRQYLADLINPISTNSTDPVNTIFFGIGHRSRSPIQRTTGRLIWEVVHEGQPYSGVPITNSVAMPNSSAAWSDLGTAGLQIREQVFKAPNFRRHKWRCRVEYPMHKMIDGQRFSRWFYGYASAVGDIGILPIELTSFAGVAESNGNLLNWNTASETNSSYFNVERSSDNDLFNVVGSIAAAGYSSRSLAYEFLDEGAPDGLSYYRLSTIDEDGTIMLSEVIAILRKSDQLVIYPMPVDNVLNWSYAGQAPSSIRVLDASGRMVLAQRALGNSIQPGALTSLSSGSYTLLLLDQNGRVLNRAQFLKR